MVRLGARGRGKPMYLSLHLFSLCLRVSVAHRAFLRKTGGVMRFGEHFCATDFYKRGNCRGNWVEIDLELSAGRVGFLVNGAQRACLKRSGESEKRGNGD